MKKFYYLYLLAFFTCYQLQSQVFIWENFDAGYPSGWAAMGFNSSSAGACEVQSARAVLNPFLPGGNFKIMRTANQVGASDGTDLTVSFDYKAESTEVGSAVLQYSTDGGTTWTDAGLTIDATNYTTSATCTNFTHTIPGASLPSGSDVMLQLVCTRGNVAVIYFVDNFHATQSLSCFPPSNVMITGLTNTSVNFSWTQGDSEAAWEYVVQAAGTGTPTAAGTPATTTSGSDTTLSASTEYEIYVRAVCGVGDESVWVGPMTFFTNCNAFTATYEQNFDGTGATTLDLCWNAIIEGSTSTAANIYNSTSALVSSPNSLRFYNANDTSGSYYLISPQFSDLDNTKRIRFQAYMNSNLSATDAPDQYAIGTVASPTDMSTFTPLYTFTSADLAEDAWVPKTFEFTGYTGTNQYIVIKYNPSTTYDYFYIDDFIYEPIPTCPEPSDLAATNITANSVDLSWTQNGTESGWEYVVQAVGTGEPTADGTSTSTIPTTVGSLMPATTYEAYVRAACSASDKSFWIGPIIFTTNCVPFTADYYQDFESETVPAVNQCWSTLINGSTNNYSVIDTSVTESFPYDDGQSIRFSNSGDQNGDYYLITPEFTDISTDKRVRFWLYMNNGGEPDTFEVGTMTDPTDVATYTTYEAIPYADLIEDGWARVIVDLDTYTGTDHYIAIKYHPGGSYNYLYLDDFHYETVPACLEPTDVEITEVGYDSALISWTDPSGTATSWQYVVQAQGTGIPTSGFVDATANPTTVMGLTGNTDYEVYIRTNCDPTGGTSYSYWSGPYYFSTQCDPYPVTYTENFDTWTFNMFPTCWKEADSGDPSTGYSIEGSGGWTYDGFANSAANGAAKIELYHNLKSDWLISPLIDLTATDPGLYQVEYDLAFMQYNSSTQTSQLGSDDQLKLLISIDNGTTWTEVVGYDSTTVIPLGGQHEVFDLAAYAGNEVQLAFWASEGSVNDAEDTDISIDNFVVTTYTIDAVDWANVQWISSNPALSCQTENNIYTQAYEPTVTDADATAAGAGLAAWIGISTANTDPSTWDEADWHVASYNTDVGNNDEFVYNTGALAAGTYYVASRWKYNDGPYRYGVGPLNAGGLWDGTTYTNVELVVNDPSPVTASADMTTVCSDANTVVLTATSDYAGYTYEWDNGAGTGASVTVNPTATTTYTVTTTSPAGCALTAEVTVTVSDPVDAGTDGTLDICEDAAAVDLFASLGGTPEAGGTWSPALTSGTGMFDPSVDAAGVYTYTVAGTAPCADATAMVTVTVAAAPDAGTDGTLAICESAEPVDLMDSLGGTPEDGGTWSPALTSGTGMFDPAVDAAGVYTYTVAAVAPCTTDGTATVTVTVDAAPAAPTADVLQEFCPDDAPTVADLVATGDNITWYDAATGGNMLASSTTLVDGTAYYAQSETASGCASLSRAIVAVNLDPAMCAQSNDDCADAESLTVEGDAVSGNTSNSTGGANTTCGGEIMDGVWYTVVGDGADLTVSVAPSDWDAQIGVFEGTCTGGFTCNTGVDEAGTGVAESVTFSSTAGTVYYILVGGNSSGTEGEFAIQVVTNLGITDIENVDSSITIYPNPVSHTLNINVDKEVVFAQIFTADGSLIKEVSSISDNAIDVHSLKPGTYILRVILDDQNIVTEKFIKN